MRLDGSVLAPHQYTSDHESGWITVALTPSVDIAVDYVYPIAPDMAVTNWDSGLGNYVYINRLGGLIFRDDFETGNTSAWSLTVP